MESRQGETSGPRQGEEDRIRRLYRHVIIQSLGDLGGKNVTDLIAARQFIRSVQFTLICEYADWDDAWIIDVMFGIDRLSPSVRGKIVSDCVNMLKALVDM